MVLIDTNIWINYLKGNLPEVSFLLTNRLVVSIEPIFAELFYGVKNKKEYDRLDELWKSLPKINCVPETLIEASKFASQNKFMHTGIGLLDAVLIKTVIDNKILIWTLDKAMNTFLDDKYIFN